MSALIRQGKVWKFGANISTDLMMPGAIYWFDVKGPERLKYIMCNRPGWAENEVQPGDIVIAGKNFGCGSSRPAPRVLRDDLGVACVVAESFSRLFQRNAVNIGFPVLICPGITDAVSEGDEIEVNFDSGMVTNGTSGATIAGEAYPPGSPPSVLLHMGGLEPFLREWLVQHPEVLGDKSVEDLPQISIRGR